MFEALRRPRFTPPAGTPPPEPRPLSEEPPHFFIGPPARRAATGHQLVVAGSVRSAETGAPIPGASVVRWHANPAGVYEDHYRSLVLADGDGRYLVQTIVPGCFAGLPRHIHFRVSAAGFADFEGRLVFARDGLPPALNAFDIQLAPQPPPGPK